MTPILPRRSPTANMHLSFEQVRPGVWRWAGPAGSDRCGTALATPDGLLLVDPPPLPEDARRPLESAAGPVRHVLLTSARHAPLAAPFREDGVMVWAPAALDRRQARVRATLGVGSPNTRAEPGANGIDRRFGFDDALPGGLLALQLPDEAAPDGEVAFLWPGAGSGLLLTGDVLPVVGQTPVYKERAGPPVAAFRDALKALLAAEPETLAPAHQAPPDRKIMFSTGYAGHIGSPSHSRRAAPVQGPRFLVPFAARVLQDTLASPVVVRLPVAGAQAQGEEEGPWLADPFACARCGKPNTPMPPTCGGPPIPRLCPDCRALRRQQLPVARLMVCAGGCCTREGARAVVSAARQAVDEHGLFEAVDVVPVSCLGECSLGPFLRVSTAQGQEPDFATAFREQSVERARRYAADEGEVIDDESEIVLSRFAALVQPREVERQVSRLARDLGTPHNAGAKVAASVDGIGRGEEADG